MKIQLRLNLITSRLQSGAKLSLSELAEEFGTSERQIRRYFTEMLPKFIDNLTQDKVTNRWYIPHNKRSTLLSEDEELTINLLVEESKKLGEDVYNQTLKLFDKFKNSIDTSTIYSKIDAESIDEIKDDMITVEKAIRDTKLITCEYKNKERKVLPLKIASFDGYWYLIIKDPLKEHKSVNSYYFKDIKNIKITNKTSTIKCDNLQRKLDNAINAYFNAENDSYPVILHATKDVARFFIRKPISKSQRILNKYEDGSIDFEVLITHKMEIIPTIKNYHPNLKVIEPNFLSNEYQF